MMTPEQAVATLGNQYEYVGEQTTDYNKYKSVLFKIKGTNIFIKAEYTKDAQLYRLADELKSRTFTVSLL